MKPPIYILGISAYYHDSAACLLRDGEIVAAAQEERFTRIKGDAGFPHHAIGYCLESEGIDEERVDHIVFYENPFVKFERLLTSYHVTSPYSLRSCLAAFPTWLTGKLWMENDIAQQLGTKNRIHFCDHHLSHAASAFFPSPFERAAILTVDGVGEWSTTTYGVGIGNNVRLMRHIRFPNSLGLLYSAFTYYAGFKVNSGEYKLMGLAPYGRPRFTDCILGELIRLREDGSFVLNQKYFDYTTGLKMINVRFEKLFGETAREPETPIRQHDMDIAASIQIVLHTCMDRIARRILEETNEEYLVMSGGVALNVVAAGKLSTSDYFKKLWIQPAAGDAGGAVGAALWYWHHRLGKPRIPATLDSMKGAFLGYDIRPLDPRDDKVLNDLGGVWDVVDDDVAQRRIAAEIAEGRVVAVARGRAEFGPRALGARSILGDARSPSMQKHMNMKIKFRESFRPFAPMVLEEKARDYFDCRQESPYMLLVYPVAESRRIPFERGNLWGIDLLNAPRSEIPAVTHIDYTARLQTVDSERHPFIHGVLRRFDEMTGCPVVVNTSFNVRGEPIVNTVEDAYRCFMATDIDSLLVGSRMLRKESQKNRPMSDEERRHWLRRFDLD
jgi:carbamoyltransferase